MLSHATPQTIHATESEPGTGTAGRPGGTLHARRVMLVVQAFTLLPGADHGPSELAAATGLNAAVVYRILQSGISTATFLRSPAGRYRLGPGAALTGMQAMATAPDARVRPVLEHLSRTVDGFALLWVLSPYGGPGKSYAASAPGRYDFESLGLGITDLIEVGNSLRVGASGRVIAAYLPPLLISNLLEWPLPAGAGPGTAPTAAEFTASLAEARESGYAVAREEIPGWTEIAAPVLWGDAVYGAVSVIKPSSLMPDDLSLPVAATTAAAERLALSAPGESDPCAIAG
ncbi:IclR family transcriptional regulator C-terminal domain-containing protein [Streptomyces sp. NPDC059142]|uniref:IclR family transcriptional regulator domain-containing protein n=1 Tax=Streptomyces sp. NPDC059142 TaxID=3346739 RepID=UPI0036B35BEB